MVRRCFTVNVFTFLSYFCSSFPRRFGEAFTVATHLGSFHNSAWHHSLCLCLHFQFSLRPSPFRCSTPKPESCNGSRGSVLSHSLFVFINDLPKKQTVRIHVMPMTLLWIAQYSYNKWPSRQELHNSRLDSAEHSTLT